MNRIQAIKALEQGHTLTHEYFGDHEWVKGLSPNFYLLEDGIQISSKLFWQDRSGDGFDKGWSIKKTLTDIIEEARSTIYTLRPNNSVYTHTEYVGRTKPLSGHRNGKLNKSNNKKKKAAKKARKQTRRNR